MYSFAWFPLGHKVACKTVDSEQVPVEATKGVSTFQLLVQTPAHCSSFCFFSSLITFPTYNLVKRPLIYSKVFHNFFLHNKVLQVLTPSCPKDLRAHKTNLCSFSPRTPSSPYQWVGGKDIGSLLHADLLNMSRYALAKKISFLSHLISQTLLHSLPKGIHIIFICYCMYDTYHQYITLYWSFYLSI